MSPVPAIGAEGARITRAAGTYDEAVRRAADAAAGPGAVLFRRARVWTRLSPSPTRTARTRSVTPPPSVSRRARAGAASLAGARAALTGDGGAGRRSALGIGPDATVVLLSTEGTAANPVGAAGAAGGPGAAGRADTEGTTGAGTGTMAGMAGTPSARPPDGPGVV
ncbi:hypothetical protein [Streptomyces lushanensis]|uniref:hypothetical protein n=1 Tax=Streptomyces lushanensis TaxID=1434255 RepID=UPI00082A02E2|nr:hypothetical protein [Streptomyces lushanensis]